MLDEFGGDEDLIRAPLAQETIRLRPRLVAGKRAPTCARQVVFPLSENLVRVDHGEFVSMRSAAVWAWCSARAILTPEVNTKQEYAGKCGTVAALVRSTGPQPMEMGREWKTSRRSCAA